MNLGATFMKARYGTLLNEILKFLEIVMTSMIDVQAIENDTTLHFHVVVQKCYLCLAFIKIKLLKFRQNKDIFIRI